MKLYYSPGSCAIGIHVLLEEIGRPYELALVNFAENAQYQPAFTSVNPKSKVPTLELDDGAVLTEFPAIAWYLGRGAPESKLLPEDVLGQARVLEAMDYVVATVHMQSFTRIFRPGNFSPNPDEHDRVKARGLELVEKAFGLLENAMGEKQYVAGDFSVADAALFYVEFWGVRRVGYDLPPHLAAHYGRMNARPAVQRVLAQQGFST